MGMDAGMHCVGLMRPGRIAVRRPQRRDAPELVSAFPALGATEVDDRRMVLEFDEYVKASNWRSQLLVSPPLDGAVELEVRGREVWVSWDEALRAQTTYVFQFGDAVADVNEGNAATNLRHAFSTGPVLDTLSIRGRVLDALTGDAQPGMRVMLFPGSWAVDSVLAGATPSYVATTLEDGRFDVSFLPSAAFHVVAVRDENRNYAWEPGEEVALLERQASSMDTTSWLLWSGTTPAPSTPYMSEAVRDEWGWASWRLSERPWSKSDSLEWLIPDDKVLQPSGIGPFRWNGACTRMALGHGQCRHSTGVAQGARVGSKARTHGHHGGAQASVGGHRFVAVAGQTPRAAHA